MFWHYPQTMETGGEPKSTMPEKGRMENWFTTGKMDTRNYKLAEDLEELKTKQKTNPQNSHRTVLRNWWLGWRNSGANYATRPVLQCKKLSSCSRPFVTHTFWIAWKKSVANALSPTFRPKQRLVGSKRWFRNSVLLNKSHPSTQATFDISLKWNSILFDIPTLEM